MFNLRIALSALLVASSASVTVLALATSTPKRVVVFGGTGYVGSAVCERLVKEGYSVKAVSRRGVNPRPKDETLEQVEWICGDATDPAVVEDAVSDVDAVVHSIGLLFDVDSGLSNFNTIVSGSGSKPGEASTYDAITRQTMFNVINALEKRASNPLAKLRGSPKIPLCFVSAAEAGWPEVTLGSTVEEKLAPEWLKKYLVAKRAVEARMMSSSALRPAMFRPSLIWDWTKFDVLPAIPVFNVASALGVPFVDKTVRVETLADAVVAGVRDDSVEGVQRYMQMEELQKRSK